MVFSVPLQDQAAHAQSATLRDPRCRLDTGGARATGSIDLNACGTTAAFTDNSVIFRNAILLSSSGNATDTIPIQCTYDRFQNVQLNYMPLVRNVLFTEAGVGQVSFRIQQFTDASFSFPVDDSSYPLDVQPGEDVFIQLIGSAVTDEVGVMAQECFVSPYSSLMQARALSTPLINNGCPASNDVRLLPSAPDDIQHVRFAFRAVTFPSQHSSIVYVHCRVGLCPRDICLQPAARNCSPNQRFRRALAADARSDVGSHQLSTGPFLVQASAGATTPSTAVVMAAVSMVVAVMATVVAMVAVVAWRRSRSNAKY